MMIAHAKCGVLLTAVLFHSEQELDDEEYARKVLRMVFSIAYFVLFLFGTVGNG